jgi:hypothetical protein
MPDTTIVRRQLHIQQMRRCEARRQNDHVEYMRAQLTIDVKRRLLGLPPQTRDATAAF